MRALPSSSTSPSNLIPSDLSIYAVKDGSCVLSSQISLLPSPAPAGAKEVQPSGAAWKWRGLFVHETGEV